MASQGSHTQFTAILAQVVLRCVRNTTSINLHNHSRTRSLNFTKHVAHALPFQRSDEGSPAVVDTLPPGTAIDIECNEIRMLLPVSMAAQYRSGVLQVRTTGAIEAMVVYYGRKRRGDDDADTSDRFERLACRILSMPCNKLPLFDTPRLGSKAVELFRQGQESGLGHVWQSEGFVITKVTDTFDRVAWPLRRNCYDPARTLTVG